MPSRVPYLVAQFTGIALVLGVGFLLNVYREVNAEKRGDSGTLAVILWTYVACISVLLIFLTLYGLSLQLRLYRARISKSKIALIGRDPEQYPFIADGQLPMYFPFRIGDGEIEVQAGGRWSSRKLDDGVSFQIGSVRYRGFELPGLKMALGDGNEVTWLVANSAWCVIIPAGRSTIEDICVRLNSLGD